MAKRKVENSLTRSYVLQFVKTKQTQPSLKAKHFLSMITFMQKFTHLDNIYFCTEFSTSESNNSKVQALSFLANNLYGKHRIAEIRTNMADCPQTDAML